MTLDLDSVTLATGKHDNRDDGVSLMEAVAWWAGEPHTARPSCVSPVLRAYGERLNNILPDDGRQALVPLIPRLAGTAGDGLDQARSYMALDWLIRTWTPTWLDLAGLTAEAAGLRDLRRIADLVTAGEAGPVVRAAQVKSAAARDAAGGADWDAARDAAWDADWDAARAAARDAAWAAAWDAAATAAGMQLGPTAAQLQTSAVELFTAMIQPTD